MQDMLQVAADSVEKSVVALRQLLAVKFGRSGGQNLLRRRKASTHWMSVAVTTLELLRVA